LPPTPTISGSPLSFCEGGNTTLTSSAVSGNQWYRNGVLIPGETGQSIIVTQGGNYTVSVTVNGCTSTSAPTTVTTLPVPATPTISIEGPTTYCSNNASVLTANAPAGLSFQWYRNGIAIPDATQNTLAPLTSGNYSVQVSNGSCSSTPAAINLTVN